MGNRTVNSLSDQIQAALSGETVTDPIVALGFARGVLLAVADAGYVARHLSERAERAIAIIDNYVEHAARQEREAAGD